jgi:hypothetical protein
MAVLVHRDQGLEHRPEFIRDPVAGRDFIHPRPGTLPFLCFCGCHTLENIISELFGYSNSHYEDCLSGSTEED